jgi:hypothetical protein
MESTNRDLLGKLFLAYAGADSFRQFVIQLRRDTDTALNSYGRTVNRLRHWQATKWDDFIRKHPKLPIPVDIETIRASLLWCDVHERHLTSGQAFSDRIGVTGRDGNSLDADFEAARDKHFPFGFGFWTLICPDCVTKCESWMINKESTRS